mmetsp:Transcript_18527/g.45471  ORF Transcript_18527/g.45471 Transcript_18527/m.45471 type:complete len:315 (-) Transcript_18527:66-1010(-)
MDDAKKRKAQKHKLDKQEGEIGFADVAVRSGRGLPKMDTRGLSDPYVVVTLENKDGKVVAKKQTKYIRQNLQPTWDAEFAFNIRNEEQAFSFKMYDHDDLGKHDFMGQLKVAVIDFMKEDWSDWFRLKNVHGDEVIGEDGTEAEILLSLKFTPLASKEQMALTRAIYDPLASEEDLKLSIRAASGTFPKKRVLLQLGSEWSIPCKRLYFTLIENKSCKECMDQFYEYVLLDAEREQNFPVLRKLGDPQFMGFPVLVVLDAYGRYIHSQGTADLEKDPTFVPHAGPDPKKVFRFLNRWREQGPADKEYGELEPLD